MIYFRCPGCHSVLSLEDNCAGMKACCPKCQQAMMLPHSRRKATIPPIVKITLWIIFMAFAGALVMCAAAIFVSQYAPIFGGVLDRTFAEPWSPVRVSLISIHIFALGLSGCVFGGFLGFMIGLVNVKTGR